MKTILFVAAAAAGIALAAGCGGGKNGGAAATPTPDPNEPQAVKDARTQFPRFLDLQVGLLSSTCSPNPGVCHNSSNYPNLQTAGDTLAFVGEPCNPEIPDPTQGWDNCERLADRINMGTFSSEVAWMQRIGPGTWTLGLKTPSASGLNGRPTFKNNTGTTVLFDPPQDWGVLVTSSAGALTASLTVGGDDFIHQYSDGVLKTIVGGDPNGNGVWGAETPAIAAASAAEFYPGSLERSYMWGRITRTVPGTRMPLANAPITEPGYVAIACWIEGLQGGGVDQPEDPIDYTHCQFAKNPVDYTAP
ncbi:MAG TPA: hypothetical protein VMV18_05610 [bacterium]|nr:hypothetical protein [bacterium]